MYFNSRMQAGRMLAAKLVPKYRYENCAILALNDGGVMVGAQIAQQLHCIMTMLLSEAILLPREPLPIGGISMEGNFVYSSSFSSGELDEMISEYRGVIEEEKLRKLHEMNQLVSTNGLVSRDLLKGHHVILVADGMPDPFMLDIALQFLKPVQIERLIVAVPFASVSAIDRMHITVDEICCLDVPAEYVSTDHYYEKHDVPSHKVAVETIENIILNWK